MKIICISCAAILNLTSILSVLFAEETTTKEFDAKKIRKLEVRNGRGNITIKTDKSEKANVTTRQQDSEKKCDFNASLEGSTLQVSIDVKDTVRGCKINLDISVPEKTEIELKSGAGNCKLNGIYSTLDAKLGSGDLIVGPEVKKIDAIIGSGDVKVSGLSEKADIKTGSGNVSLVFSEKSKKGSVDIKSGSGDVDISLPTSAKPQLSFRSGSGDLETDFPTDKSGNFDISFFSGSGDLKIKKIEK